MFTTKLIMGSRMGSNNSNTFLVTKRFGMSTSTHLLHVHICVTSKISPENCCYRSPSCARNGSQASEGLNTTTSDMAFRSLLRPRCHRFYVPSSDELDNQHILIGICEAVSICILTINRDRQTHRHVRLRNHTEDVLTSQAAFDFQFNFRSHVMFQISKSGPCSGN